MSETSKPEVGAIGWADLTVENAEQVRDFYRVVVGWKVTELSMGDYNDYCMNTPTGRKTVAGVCHARGTNADLPPQWLNLPDRRRPGPEHGALPRAGRQGDRRSQGSCRPGALLRHPGPRRRCGRTLSTQTLAVRLPRQYSRHGGYERDE